MGNSLFVQLRQTDKVQGVCHRVLACQFAMSSTNDKKLEECAMLKMEWKGYPNQTTWLSTRKVSVLFILLTALPLKPSTFMWLTSDFNLVYSLHGELDYGYNKI